LEELRLDYEDHLREWGLEPWSAEDPRRDELIARRCTTAKEVADWVRELHGRSGQNGRYGQPTQSTVSTRSTYRELAANAALVLIAVACSLLDRQIAALERAFVQNGGFTERLYRVRSNRRGRERAR
jgi:four helix bundle suffix protein